MARARRCLPAAGLIVLLAAVTLLWFYPVPYDAFAGDDLMFILQVQSGEYASSLGQALTVPDQGKYRPVYALVAYLEASLFGHEFSSYVYFNMVIGFLNGLAAAALAWRLSNRSWIAAGAVGVITLTSRFSYFSVYQALGPLEGGSLLLLILTLHVLLSAWQSGRWGYWLLSTSLYFLLVHTHERYVAVAPFLVLAALFSSRLHGAICKQVVLAALPLAVVIFNYAMKVWVFHIEFFTGTGGTRIAFDYLAVAQFFGEGVINLLGFNAGPSYLSGLKTTWEVPEGIALGLAFAVCVGTIAVLYAAGRWRQARTGDTRLFLHPVAVFAVLLATLLASASMTTRQEYRWLYPPFVVMVFGLTYALARAPVRTSARLVILLWLLLSAVGVDVFNRRYLDNVYFMDSLRVSDSARVAMVFQHGAEMHDREVFLAVSDVDRPVRTWYFRHDAFFQLYTGNPAVHITYVNNIESIPYRTLPLDAFLAFGVEEKSRQVVDLLPQLKDLAVRAPQMETTPLADFAGLYERGTVIMGSRVARPDELGAQLTEWPTEPKPRKSISVASGCGYRSGSLTVSERSYLLFSAATPYAESDGVFGYVDIISEGAVERVFGAELPPVRDGAIQWREYLIPLSRYAARPVTFVFGAETRLGSRQADWAAFREPQVRTAKAAGQQ